ncbi:DUF368 domain-containing protein [soil metagenome]
MNAPLTPQPRTFKDSAKLYLKGLVMGSADVVPGVSGGTMALILGVYEELILSLQSLSQPAFLQALLSFKLGTAFEAANGRFLVTLLAGIATAVLLFARVITWLLETQQSLLYSLFFGLILASVFVVGRRVRRWSVGPLMALVASAVGAFLLVGLSPTTTPDSPWFLVLSGALAICAMVLPGISGAFILLLLGKYVYVLNAISHLDIVAIVLFGCGAVVGLLSFVRLLGLLFTRHYDLTIALLTGFMLGSLRKIWPWKRVVGDDLVANSLPHLYVNGGLNLLTVASLLLLVLGVGIVLVLNRVSEPTNS